MKQFFLIKVLYKPSKAAAVFPSVFIQVLKRQAIAAGLAHFVAALLPNSYTRPTRALKSREIGLVLRVDIRQGLEMHI